MLAPAKCSAPHQFSLVRHAHHDALDNCCNVDLGEHSLWLTILSDQGLSNLVQRFLDDIRVRVVGLQ